MSTDTISIDEMIRKIDAAWADFMASQPGMSDEELLVPGVTGEWSARDILAHVAVWDTYARNALPGILETGRPAASTEDTDTYNARMTEEKRGLSLEEVRTELEESHQRLLDYLRSLDPASIAGNTAFTERLAADTWDHYPDHAAAIRTWREARG